jgi:hypothetical protein
MCLGVAAQTSVFLQFFPVRLAVAAVPRWIALLWIHLFWPTFRSVFAFAVSTFVIRTGATRHFLRAGFWRAGSRSGGHGNACAKEGNRAVALEGFS